MGVYVCEITLRDGERRIQDRVLRSSSSRAEAGKGS